MDGGASNAIHKRLSFRLELRGGAFIPHGSNKTWINKTKQTARQPTKSLCRLAIHCKRLYNLRITVIGMKRDIYIPGVSELEVLLDLVLAKLSTLHLARNYLFVNQSTPYRRTADLILST